MSKQILVVAPHPDDETLGCGGTLLRHKAEGESIHWLIMTEMKSECDFPVSQIEQRKIEIITVAEKYRFSSIHALGFPAVRLDTIPMNEIIQKVSSVIREVTPEIIYVPYRGDIHTDHKIVFDSIISCSKWFRFDSIRRLLSYEVISETGFGLDPNVNGFKPNVFVNIDNYLEKKLEIMKVYKSELAEFPFPRSEQAIRGLAAIRGSESGCQAAEAFMLLKEIV